MLLVAPRTSGAEETLTEQHKWLYRPVREVAMARVVGQDVQVSVAHAVHGGMNELELKLKLGLSLSYGDQDRKTQDAVTIEAGYGLRGAPHRNIGHDAAFLLPPLR